MKRFAFAASIAVVMAACAACTTPAPDAQSGVRRGGLFVMPGSIADEATTYENAATQNGGGYTEACVGNVGTTTTTRRSLVRYTLPTIPAGATVTRVQLSFTQENVRSMGGGPRAATLELRAVTSAWTEGAGAGMTRSCGGGQAVAGVTWNTMPSVAAVVSASAALPSTTPATINFDSDSGGHAGLRTEASNGYSPNGAS